MTHLPPGAYRRYMRVVGIALCIALWIALWTGIITALVLRIVGG